MQAPGPARGVGAVVGGVTLLLGASGVFSELEGSLNFIWRVKPQAPTGIGAAALQALKAKAFSFAVVVVAAGAALASLVLSSVLAAVENTARGVVGAAGGWRVVDATLSVGFVTLLLATMYRVVPKGENKMG